MGCYPKGNRWYIDYYVNSKRKREVVTIPEKDPATITLRDAEKALAIRKAEIAQGKFDITKTEKPIKFEKLIEAYLEWADENHKSPERDHSACKNLLAHFSGKNIYSLSLWEVEKYKSERKKQGRQPETINKELGVIRRMFNLATEGALKVKSAKNPIEGLKLLKVPPKKTRKYSSLEFQKLYEAAPNHFKPILLCAYITGMRRGEIVNLKWRDIHLEDEYIYVAETKTDEPRTIPICESLLSTLLQMKKKSDCEFVFTTPNGKPYTSKTVWKTAWGSTLKRSGIPKGRFHDFRHTFMTDLIVDEKEDFATVMALSGHKSMSMLKRYTHAKEEAKKTAMKKRENHVNISTMDTYLDTKADMDPLSDNTIIGLTNRKH